MSNRKSDRDGSASVELAVLMPFLMTVVLGTVDFGQFGTTSIAVNNAAQSGAFYASNSPANSTNQVGIRNAVLQDLPSLPGVSSVDVIVVATTGLDDSKNPKVVVTVSVPFKTLFGFPARTITISQTSQMRIRPDQTRTDGF